MIGIYKITNPKGKIYIGQSIDIEKRFYIYRNIKNCKFQILLYRSLLKYGVENHIFEVIEECCIELLNESERYWQDFYNVLDGGLNCKLTKTNDKSGKTSESSKLKMSIAKKGKIFTEEHLKNLKIASKKRVLNRNNNVAYEAKPHSEETKIKMSLAKLGKKRPNFKPFFSIETREKLSLLNKDRKSVLNIYTGIFYETVKEASIAYSLNYGTLRCKLNGRRKNNTDFICI